jgi:putative ABC transport system permease protein
MFTNHLKIAWRNLTKNKGFTLINIGGLAIGLACFLMIALYIRHELSYDSYHEKAENIYRVVHHSGKGNIEDRWIWGNAPVGPALKADFPEIVEVARFSGRSDIMLEYNKKTFQEANTFYADPTVFDLFSWPMLSGNPKTALETAYSIVLTESTAKKYFGQEDPMGKVLKGIGGRANDGSYTVTGIIEDIPANSHFSFDALMSMESFYQTRPGIFDAWGYVDFYTYFLVADNFDQKAFQAKMPDFLKKNRTTEPDEYFYDLSFEPLSDMYLKSDAVRQPGATGKLTNLYIFGIIGIFILIIGCINYMNLATARSLERAKEVGIRKVVGAAKKGLVAQFFTESIITVMLAAILGLTLVQFALPWLRSVTNKPIGSEAIFSSNTLIIYLSITLFTALLSGLYPALALSGFKPSSVLKGKFSSSTHGNRLRKGLVVFQFSLSIALIASTFIVYDQLGHMLDKNLGFDQEQQLNIDYNWDQAVNIKVETIKAEFMDLAEVSSTSHSRTVPGTHFPAAGTTIQNASGEMETNDIFLYEVDYDFVPHYDIEMVAGRNYSREFASDTIAALVVNEATAKSLGYSQPEQIVGKPFEQWGRQGKIIGVVKDFNYTSLHKSVAPLSLRHTDWGRYLSLKVKSDDLPGAMARIEQKWSELAPHRPFLYSFLDEALNAQYSTDIKFRKLFTLFSLMAIFIACLGLLGLATYSANQRTKEIGVRKVLGAELGNIVLFISKDFVKLVGFAILIAVPLSWYAMDKWLLGYAYRIQIQWWVFLLAGCLSILIAVTTISLLALRAAKTDPVKSLRTE